MQENDFEDRIRFGNLYEMYGALLTAKQRAYLELYFCEDLSQAEIADEMKVSRQAVHDLLKRVEQTLEHYEALLGFFKTSEQTYKVLTKVQGLIEEAQAKKSTAKLPEAAKLLNQLSSESR